MDYYEAWFNLKNTHKDLEFCEDLAKYLGALKVLGLLEGYRMSRRKLGFGPSELGEFHLTMEVKDMAQLERLFERVSRRDGEIEALHRAVYSAVKDVKFGLYRDFPDPSRAPLHKGPKMGFV